MGHGENKRKSENKPEKGALDTNQDKSLEKEKKTSRDTEESLEPKEITETITEEEKAKEIAGEEEKEEPVVEEEPQEEIEVEEEAEKEREEVTEEKEEKEKRKEEAEEEIVEERIYNIPLRRAWISPRKKRAPRAVRIMRNFIQRHMKLETGVKGEEEETSRLVISNEVNEKLWGRGIEKPPRKIRVRAVKDKEGTVTLYLAEGD